MTKTADTIALILDADEDLKKMEAMLARAYEHFHVVWSDGGSPGELDTIARHIDRVRSQYGMDFAQMEAFYEEIFDHAKNGCGPCEGDCRGERSSTSSDGAAHNPHMVNEPRQEFAATEDHSVSESWPFQMHEFRADLVF